MILITRPSKQAKPTKIRLKQMGLQPLIYSMLEINILTNINYENLEYNAIIVTSQNGATALARCNQLKYAQVFVVGIKTAERLQQVGFYNIKAIAVDHTDLIIKIKEIMKPHSSILYLRGSHIAADIANLLCENYILHERVVYHSAPKNKMNKRVITLLSNRITHVLFYSARTAMAFAALTQECNLSKVRAICISHNVSLKLSHLSLAEVLVAAHPNENAMLELLNE